MNPNLLARVEQMRAMLEKSPDGLIAGEIRGPARECISDILAWPALCDFLRVADGGRFGSIDLWAVDELPEKQYVATGPPTEEKWLVIGQLLYEPLVLNANGVVHVLHVMGSERDMESLGKLDDFLYSIMGAGYAKLVADGEKDEWWALLVDAGLAR